MADGFLGRWSRRKLDVKEGKPLEEPVVAPVVAPAVTPAPAVEKEGAIGAPAATHDAAANPSGRPPATVYEDSGLRRHGNAGEPAAALPTLEDVKSLSHQGDFRPYMAQGVAPEVKNAAMRKLFADPHFNVMDRLDTYIDDYSQPDPIPPSMLRNMVGSKLLGLFDEEEKKEALAPSGDGEVADAPPGQSVAQSYANPDIPNPGATATTSQPDASPGAGASQEHDAHTDLRLQPDDAAQPRGTGRGAP